MPVGNQLLHVAIEEGQKQGDDVGTIHIRVGHEDDLAIAEVFEAELMGNTRPQCLYQGFDLDTVKSPIHAGLLYIEDLATQRQHGLEATISPLFGCATCRITLDDKQLSGFSIALGAIGQLATKGTGL